MPGGAFGHSRRAAPPHLPFIRTSQAPSYDCGVFETPVSPAGGVPGAAVPEAPGGTVSVRPLPDGEEIVLTPTSWVRFPIAAFLAFWLCGWAIGEVVALAFLLGPLATPILEGLRELLPGRWPRPPRVDGFLPWPVLAFLAVWLSFWTWGGLGAMWELLRILAGSDRFTVRPGAFTWRRAAGPFGRRRLFSASEVTALFAEPRRSRVVATVRGKEVLLSSGTPANVAEWLAGRLRAALGLPDPGAAADAEAAGSIAPSIPAGFRAEPLPDGGVFLGPAPEKSKRASGCGLTVAALVTSAFVASLVFPGHRAVGVMLVLAAATLAIDLLCLWAAFARETWLLRRDALTRSLRVGPWERRREVRRGTLVVSLSGDSDGDDWFTLEVKGDGGPLRLAREMNDGSTVLAFARYAAFQTGFPLDVPRDVRVAARELPGG